MTNIQCKNFALLFHAYHVRLTSFVTLLMVLFCKFCFNLCIMLLKNMVCTIHNSNKMIIMEIVKNELMIILLYEMLIAKIYLVKQGVVKYKPSALFCNLCDSCMSMCALLLPLKHAVIWVRARSGE